MNGIRALGLTMVAVVLAVAASARADEFNWLGTSGSATYWKDSSKWTNQTTGATGYPTTNHFAKLMQSIDGWTYLDIQSGAGCGSLRVRNRWGQYRIRTTWTGTYNFTFDNLGQPSTVCIGHSSGGTYWGQIQFGIDGASDKVTRINLMNDLIVTNEASKPSHGRFDVGPYGSIIGGSSSARRTITIQASGGKQMLLTQGGAATFVGDWIVDGSNAKLDMNKDAFGDASNTIRLRNGGALDMATLDAFAWKRDLIVEPTGGTLLVGSSFTNDTGRILFPALDNSIGTLAIASTSGVFRLASGSTLVATNTLPAGTYPLLTSSIPVEGTFGNVLWPEDRQGLLYELVYAPSAVDLKVSYQTTLVTIR